MQSLGHVAGNLFLHGKNVGKLAVPGLRPIMIAVLGALSCGQRLDDFLGQPVAEVLVVGIGAEIQKGRSTSE
jgi:hypothetical protein